MKNIYNNPRIQILDPQRISNGNEKGMKSKGKGNQTVGKGDSLGKGKGKDANEAQTMQAMMSMMQAMMSMKGKGKGKWSKKKREEKGGAEKGGAKLVKKQELNVAVMKIIANPDLQKGAIVYSTKEVMGLDGPCKQTEITISALPNFLADNAFVGEVLPTESEAIESAAEVALNTIMADPELKLLHDTKNPKKRKATTSSGSVEGEKKAKLNNGQPKVKLVKKALLNETISKICGPLKKGSIEYSTENAKGGKQTKVTVNCLPSASQLAETVFTGDVCPTDSEAVESAAGVAIDTILQDTFLKEVHDGTRKLTSEEAGTLKIQQETGKPAQTNRSLLNCTITKILSTGSMKKGQIQYSTEDVEGGKQSKVTISCLPEGPDCSDMTTFTGEVRPMESEAVESAAAVAVDMILANPFFKKLHDEGGPEKKQKKEAGNREELNNKSQLNTVLAKILRRTTDHQVTFSTTDVSGGKQCQVKVGSLPNALAEKSFVGEVCSGEKLAINSAAGVALEAILGDPELKELHDKPKKVKLRPDGTPYEEKGKKEKKEKKE